MPTGRRHKAELAMDGVSQPTQTVYYNLQNCLANLIFVES